MSPNLAFHRYPQTGKPLPPPGRKEKDSEEADSQTATQGKNKGKAYILRARKDARRRMNCPHPSPNCSAAQEE